MDNVQIFTKSSNTKSINLVKDERIEELKKNQLLSLAISKLPQNYNFEIYKSIIKIKSLLKPTNKPKPIIALQFPDGLMIFSVLISDILTAFADCQCVILGDITYGACCIDDFGAKALDCDLIIHYAHSCLIPITDCLLPTLYVFVEIAIDFDHLIQTIEFNLPKETNPTIYLLGSIQFNSSLFVCKRALKEKGYSNVSIPQAKPRASGEILGCTAPILESKKDSQSYVIFVCDGRFHMESIMIQNPGLIFYQYNPFTTQMTIEEYDYEQMKAIRYQQIELFRKAKCIGVLFGTLGRQGDEGILKRIVSLLNENHIEHYVICLNEITQEKIEKFPQCEAFVQIACPRLSIDWSNQFDKPMITPFECYVALNKTHWNQYPMDNYSYNGGEWGHYPKDSK